MNNSDRTTLINSIVEDIRDLEADLAELDGTEWFAREQTEIALSEARTALLELTV